MPVINKYLPEQVNNPLAWAGIATVMIFAPRILGYWQLRRKRTSEKPIEPPKTEPEKPKETENKTEQAASQSPAKELTPEKPKGAGFLDKL